MIRGVIAGEDVSPPQTVRASPTPVAAAGIIKGMVKGSKCKKMDDANPASVAAYTKANKIQFSLIVDKTREEEVFTFS